MIEKQPRRPISGGEILPWAEDVNDTLRKARMSDTIRPSRKFRTSYRDRYQFKVEPKTASTLIVRGGSWTRAIGDGSTVRTVVNLTTDAGTSADRDDFKTLTVSGSGTFYVTLTLNDADAPTTLTASLESALPSSGVVAKVIAVVSVSSDELAGPIKQVWTGGNILDVVDNTDNVSIHRNTSEYDGDGATASGDGELAINDWDQAESVAVDEFRGLGANDFFMFQGYSPAAGPDPYQRPLNYIAYLTLLAYIATDIVDTGGPWEDAPWEDIDEIKHTRLDFTPGASPKDTAATNDDHDYRYPEPDTPTASTDANTLDFTFSSSTTAGSGTGAIKIDNGGLYSAAGVYVTKGAAAQAGYFSDGSNGAVLCDGTSSLDANGTIQTEGNISVLSGSGGVFQHFGNNGVTGDGFSGGIKTDASAADAAIASTAITATMFGGLL